MSKITHTIKLRGDDLIVDYGTDGSVGLLDRVLDMYAYLSEDEMDAIVLGRVEARMRLQEKNGPQEGTRVRLKGIKHLPNEGTVIMRRRHPYQFNVEYCVQFLNDIMTPLWVFADDFEIIDD